MWMCFWMSLFVPKTKAERDIEIKAYKKNNSYVAQR